MLIRVDPAFRVSRLEGFLGPYRSAEFLDKYKEGVRKAGLPEGGSRHAQPHGSDSRWNTAWAWRP
jgi:hypothetical protein